MVSGEQQSHQEVTLLSQTTSKQFLVTLDTPKSVQPSALVPSRRGQSGWTSLEANSACGTLLRQLINIIEARKIDHGKVLRTKRIRSSDCGQLGHGRAALWVVNEVMTTTLPIETER